MHKASVLTVIEITEDLSTYQLGCLVGWLKMWLEETPAHHATVDNFIKWLALERKKWEASVEYEDG